MVLHYFEVSKLPKSVVVDNELELLLALFRVKTEEELAQLEALEVPIVTQAIGVYREMTVSAEFRELERLRADARRNEASALYNAEQKGAQIGAAAEREKWELILAAKEAEIAQLHAMLGETPA
jgi:hypothetical protein